jgi:hypothetical protein
VDPQVARRLDRAVAKGPQQRAVTRIGLALGAAVGAVAKVVLEPCGVVAFERLEEARAQEGAGAVV